ncbi:MAG: MBL fold metallo-hydrolase [Spirochaetales bacterium]|nr:MBL fold metallo-hydrolase [Spirochaetales bacterium]
MSIRLYSKGGAEEVTGSRHFLSTPGGTLQIDCGAFQGRRKEAEAKNRAFEGNNSHPDAVILTHAHFDHSGLLPLMAKNGYRGNIYATPATRDLAGLIMLDSAKIQARDIEFLTKQAEKRGENFQGEALFDEQDALTAMNQFVTVSYGREIFVQRDISCRFYDSGHILGSSIAYLSVKNNGTATDIAFTGDLGRKNKPIIRDPERIPTPDYLVLESTYGDRLHEDTGTVMNHLAEVINRTAGRGGRVIIPAFAIERTQELIYYIHLLLDQKKISPIPVYLDSPMAVNATSIFQIHPECYDRETYEAFTRHHANPFGFNDMNYITHVEKSKALNDKKEPIILISADGMCEAGRIRHHLVHGITDPRNTVLIVGYMAAHTLGRRIRDREKEVKIFGQTFPLKAEVEEINALSAHADYRELGEYVSAMDLKKLKEVFLVHGEEKAREHLKSHLLGLGVSRVTALRYGEEYELTN